MGGQARKRKGRLKEGEILRGCPEDAGQRKKRHEGKGSGGLGFKLSIFERKRKEARERQAKPCLSGVVGIGKQRVAMVGWCEGFGKRERALKPRTERQEGRGRASGEEGSY